MPPSCCRRGEAAGAPTLSGHAEAPPEALVAPGAREASRVSLDPDSPEAVACRPCRVPPSPAKAPLRPEAQEEARGGRGRPAGTGAVQPGEAQTHPLPPAAASSRAPRCPLQAAGTLPAAPTHREQPRLWLEVAAVAMGPGHGAAAGSSQPRGRRREAAAGPGYPAPREPPQRPTSRPAPRGATTAQAAGPGAEVLGLGGRDGCASLLTPAPRMGLVPLHQAREKAMWTFPSGLPRGVRPISRTETDFVPLGS